MDGKIYVPTESGHLVSEEFCRLAEVIHDYDPNLELRWIEPEHRETKMEKKEPYCIWDIRINKPVMFATERDTPQSMLARLWGSDNTKHDVLHRIELENNAVKALQQKAWMDKLEEAREEAEFFMKTPKHTFTMNGKKFDERKAVGPAVDRTYIT